MDSNLAVSALFPDVVQCMAVQVLEIKKSTSLRYHWIALTMQWFIFTSSTMGGLNQRRSDMPFLVFSL